MADGAAWLDNVRPFSSAPGADAGDSGDTGDEPSVQASEPSSAAGDTQGAPGTGFRVDEAGVWHEPDGGDSQWICSPLHVTAMTRNADGEAWGRLLEFPDDDDRWHHWACPMELLAADGAEFRRELLSQGLRIASGTKARNLLTTYVQTAAVETRAVCSDRTGWHGDVYVLPDGAIGDCQERILLQTTGTPPKMRQSGTAEAWREHVAALCAGNSRLVLAVSAAFAAPLVGLVGDESGGLHFVGASSTGKTAALWVAGSVYGGSEYLHRWRSTANGLEAVATSHNDGLLILDELAQVDPQQAGEVAYMLANGTGKHRARRDGRAKPAASWRLLFLSAGEIGLADHMREVGKRARAGQEVRFADVPVEAEHGIYEQLHGRASGAVLSDELMRAADMYYGAPIRTYLRAVTSHRRTDMAERIRSLRDDFSANHVPAGADGQARRVAGRFGLVAAGGELATSLNLTGWSVGEAAEAAGQCYRAWLDHRGGAGSGEDAAALAAVRHFLESHGDARFTPLGEPDTRRTPNRAGYRRWIDGAWQYLILSEVFRAEVCQGLDHRRVARLLRDRGLLVCEGPDRLTVKPRDVGRAYAVWETIHNA